MKLPTFLIIGVEKSGTTSIYNYLKQHPQVYMSPIKETNFLERDWERDKSEKKAKIITFEAYRDLFKDATDEIAIGEASPNYLFHCKTSIPRIKQYVPNVKAIAILRDPVERAYSDYLMHIRDAINFGKVKTLSEQVQFSARSSFTLRKGLYCEPVQHFFDNFGRDRVKICLYDDLSQNSETFMQDIYRFLEVDDRFNADTSQRAQTAAVPKNILVNRLIRTKNPVRSAIAPVLKLVFSQEMRDNIRKTLIRFNSQEKEAIPLTPEEKQMLQDYYREDILKLQDLLQRDLSAWLG
ncbi:MAG: sulfotransferase [Cyanobacteria bacterium SBLK]|nr:sulfotransferase [Cyanobacteria bacterium SBLK]